MKYAIALILLASGCLAPAQPTSRTHQAVSANILVNQKLLFDSTVGDNRLGNLCVDGTHLYWSDENGEFGTIWQLSKSGGGARRVAKMMNEVVTIACAAGGIAWIDEELIEKPAPAKSDLVKRVKFLAPGGKPKTLASLDEDGKETAEWVGIDAERVYWIIQEAKKNGNSPGEVWSASRTGGAPQRIVKNLIDPESAGLDRDHIYIVCKGHNTTIPAILAAPKSGGKAVEVARVLDKPADHGTEVSVNSLTASGSSLYWALSAGRQRFGAVIPSDPE